MEALDDLTYKIIKCAMLVHNNLGNGFQEVIYQRALAIEFYKNGLLSQREIGQEIFYASIKIGTRRVDFIVENEIIVEIKALISLEKVHLAQTKNYLKAFNKPTGLLINFGAPSLEFKKIFNSKSIP
ncbi:MAG: GxxExxY protein [Saprospiraceae bacterium]